MTTQLIFKIVALVASYLLGSIPFGLLIGKAKGIDIRTAGSGNIGATNVFRCVGKEWGIFTFVLDMLKGMTAAMLFPLMIPNLGEPERLGWSFACGALAIVGHNWPCWLKFKGGKGISTSLGFLIGVAPLGAGAAALVWILVFVAFRYVSLASICAALALAAMAWFYYLPQAGLLWFPILLTLLAVLAIAKHHENIRRLLKGTENRFSFSKKKSSEG